jgi:RHS repeat-associated protein
VSSFEYENDRNGNRVRQVETHGGQPPETTTYAYDGADRLLDVTYPDKITSYTYDGAGNRQTETDTDLAGETVLADKLYSYNVRNQLTAMEDLLDSAGNVTYGYDANGNRVSRLTGSGGVTDLTFDVRDRLIAVEEDGLSLGIYGYDFQGLRVIKTTPDGSDRYVYDDQSVLLRTSDGGRTTKYDYGPFQLLSVDDSEDGRAFYLFDALGSISELTTSTGTILGRYVWDAWGNKRSSVETGANPFGFTGHEHDEKTGLVYLKARFYDSVTGIFLSQDLVLGNPMNPSSLHRYLYAYQNPTVFVDLNGQWPTWNEVKSFGKGLAIGVGVGLVAGASVAVLPVATLVAIGGIAAVAAVDRYSQALDDTPDPDVVQVISLGVSDVIGATAVTESISGLEIGTGRRLSGEERTEKTGAVLGAFAGGAAGFRATRAVAGTGQALAQAASEGFTLGVAEIWTGRVGPAALQVTTEAASLTARPLAESATRTVAESKGKAGVVEGPVSASPSVSGPVASSEAGGFVTTRIKTSGIEEQIKFLVKEIPGLDRTQARSLLEEAFKRDSSVVFGGSRIRGNFRPDSDLDVGFGNLSTNQARTVLIKAEKEGGLKLETNIRIVPGNKPKTLPEISTPEEFFQRSGTRQPPDPRAGEPFEPSGTITVDPDGAITIIQTGVQH